MPNKFAEGGKNPTSVTVEDNTVVSTRNMKSLKTVKIVSRPGYFGKNRTQIISQLDQKYLGWQECWQIGDMILDFSEAVLLYDDSYYHYFNQNPQIVDWVISFGECYDSERSNIATGTNHDSKAIPRHIQDVSVRRALVRLGTYFKNYYGNDHTLYKEEQLLHIRGKETNGFGLMPGNIPFHKPELIMTEQVDNMPSWIQPGTVESYWQSNKVIVIDCA